MIDKGWISMFMFVATSGLILAFFVWRNRDIWQAKARMRDLGAGPRERSDKGGGLGQLVLASLPSVGTPLLPTNEAQRSRLRQRLIEAGIYDRHALPVLLERLSRGCSGSGSARRTYPVGAASRAAPSAATAT
jgi:hypothetical protein